MNKLQNQLLELLKIFDSFCKENDILYTLHGGTLLGAIRNKEFIEWDDDIDVAMSRSDYNRFVSLLEKNNNTRFKYDININPYQFYLKDSKDLVWLDIFVYDYISSNKIGRKLKIVLEDIFMTFNKNDKNLATTKVKWSYPKYLFIKFVSLIGKLLPKSYVKNTLAHIREKSLCGDRHYVHRSNDHHKGRLEIHPISILEDYMYVDFEDTKLMVSKEYERILIASYGEDYMIPKKPDEASILGHDLTRNSGK